MPKPSLITTSLLAGKPAEGLDLSPHPVKPPEDLVNRVFRRRTPKKKKQPSHPVISGRSPNFLFVVQPKPEKPKQAVDIPVNKEILSISKKIGSPMGERLKANQRAITKFLITEIAPLTLPASSAIEDAKDILKEILGVDVPESTLYAHLQKYMKGAAEAKVEHWIRRYMNLSQEEISLLAERANSEKLNGTLEKVLSGLRPVHPVSRQEEGLSPLLRKILEATRKNQAG